MVENVTYMNKATPLAVFITCLNRCFGYYKCTACTAYNKEQRTCLYSNPYSMFAHDDIKLLCVYSREHAIINCTKCNISGKHDSNIMCVYNQIKILCKLKHPEVK